MSDKEQTTVLIDIYMNLLRIEKAKGEERDREIGNQLRAAKAKLETLGVLVEKLTID